MKKALLSLAFTGLLTIPALTAPDSDTEATLSFYMRDSGDFLAAFERAQAQFKEMYPNVTVELIAASTGSGWGSYINNLVNQMAAGTPPDVLEIAIEGFLAISSRDLLVDLGPLLNDEESQAILSDIAPGLLTNMESPITGELNYFPLEWNNIVIYYNKDMFDEAGVAYPENGWTWSEFVDTAKALTKKDDAGNVTRFGYRIPGFNFGITPWFLANGTDKINSDWTESNVTDPAFAETMEFLHSLIHEHGVSPTYSGGVGDQEFSARQVAMFSCGHWCTPGIQSAGLDNVGVVMPPVPDEGGEAITVFGIGGMGVFKSSENPELALEFVKVFAGEDFQKDVSTSRFSIPASRTWATTEAYLAFPDNSEVFYESADSALPISSPPNFAQVEEIFMRNLENYLTGNTDLESALSTMDSEMTRSMSRAYR